MRKLAKVAMVVSLFAATVGLAVPMAPPPAVDASSHREAPLTAFDPQVDATDLYAFVSPDRPDTVTLIANYVPLQIPYGGPNFYRFGDDVLYEINVDNNGDTLPDVKYQFRFRTTVTNPDTFLYNTGPITSLGDATWNVRQSYSVTRVDNLNRGGQGTETVLHNNLISPPVNVGFRSTPNYDNLANAAIHTVPSGTGDPTPIRVFAGQREDPFFVDLAAIFDLLHVRKLPGNAGGGRDALAGVNVNSIALQIPINQLTRDGRVPANKDATNAVIGVWTTSSRRSMPILRGGDDLQGAIQGGWRQVSRLGHPLVNEVVVPLAFKDHFNGSEPKDDAQFLAKVVDPEMPKLLNAIYQVNVPPTPRLDLVA
ncbi:MAG: DUF4331 domain-containing protein, partial [Chloroflexi bacterium]|nr:DUF4331 domain-containing protein [Chloroflexota bacterium]